MKKNKEEISTTQPISTRDKQTIEYIDGNNYNKKEEKEDPIFDDDPDSSKENMRPNNIQMKIIKDMNISHIQPQFNLQSQSPSQLIAPINTLMAETLQSSSKGQEIQQKQKQERQQQQQDLGTLPMQSLSLSKPKLLSINENVKEELRKDKQNYYGKILKAVVFCTIILQYLTYILFIEIKLPLTLFRLIIFHILFSLMIGSLYSTIRTNPGNIPLYWGFYIGDDEFKKKRYCLLCQVFKPDRTHHCSICNVCVLNMDHHCPWINNCIGFYNRKYFVQLLFYFLMTVTYLDCAYLPVVYSNCFLLYQSRHSRNYPLFLSAFLLLFNYTCVLGLTVLDFFFFKFHMKLVLKNCSTIESLDEDFLKKNKFDLGMFGNWVQVFGKNKILWFLPLMIETAYPDGDGLNWPVNQLTENMTLQKEIKYAGENKSTSTKQGTSTQSQYQSNYSTNATNSHRTMTGQIIELAHKPN